MARKWGRTPRELWTTSWAHDGEWTAVAEAETAEWGHGWHGERTNFRPYDGFGGGRGVFGPKS